MKWLFKKDDIKRACEHCRSALHIARVEYVHVLLYVMILMNDRLGAEHSTTRLLVKELSRMRNIRLFTSSITSTVQQASQCRQLLGLLQVCYIFVHVL